MKKSLIFLLLFFPCVPCLPWSKSASAQALQAGSPAASEPLPVFVFAGAFWMQGGADAKSEEMANAYADNLDLLIAAMRKDFKNPTLPVVAGLTSSMTAEPHPSYPAAATIRDAQLQSRDHYATIDTSDITRGSDKIHFDTPGIATLGNNMAEAMLQLLKASANQ